jgi:hypothetical protein
VASANDLDEDKSGRTDASAEVSADSLEDQTQLKKPETDAESSTTEAEQQASENDAQASELSPRNDPTEVSQEPEDKTADGSPVGSQEDSLPSASVTTAEHPPATIPSEVNTKS